MDNYVLILLAVFFSAFFSGMEIAFVSSNRLRIELDRKQKVFGAQLTKVFVNNPGQFIATMLIGNNICLVIYGIITAQILGPVISPLVGGSEAATMIIITLLSTAIILIAAEFFPKAVFRISPNFFLRLLSVPTFIFYMLFYPVSKSAVFISNAILAIFSSTRVSRKENEENLIFGRADLDHLVSINVDEETEDESERENIRIFQNALDFSNIKVRECMVPRTEIEAVDITTGVDVIRERFISTRYSRILVYSGSIDQVAGYVELKDIFRNPSDLQAIIRKLAIVPETMTASRLLKKFIEEKVNIAVVVDEFGGTSGMVTIEDVVEEIVGEIEDEHDTSEMVEKQTGPNEYVFSGRLEVDYLNDKYNLGLPEKDDYETLAGMVLYYHGSIPRNNDTVRIENNILVRVLKSTFTRIDLVSLRIIALKG